MICLEPILRCRYKWNRLDSFPTHSRVSPRGVPQRDYGIGLVIASHRVRRVAAIALLALLGACHPEGSQATPTTRPTVDPSHIDRSLLTTDQCSPPCWYGLEPGKSTELDVETALRGLEFVDADSIRHDKTSWVDGRIAKLIVFDCRAPVSRRCGVLTLVDRILVEIGLPILFEVTFERVVDELGKPDIFFIQAVHVELTDCTVGLAWEELGVLITSNMKSGEQCNELRARGAPSATELVSGSVYGESGMIPAHGGLDLPWIGFYSP